MAANMRNEIRAAAPLYFPYSEEPDRGNYTSTFVFDFVLGGIYNSEI